MNQALCVNVVSRKTRNSTHNWLFRYSHANQPRSVTWSHYASGSHHALRPHTHHVLITHYAPIMHRAFSVGEEEGWNKRHKGGAVWWFNFFLIWSTVLFLFHSQVAASEHSCYQTVVVFNGQQLLLGVKVDKFSEPWNIKKKGISWNVKVYFQDFAAQLVT